MQERSHLSTRRPISANGVTLEAWRDLSRFIASSREKISEDPAYENLTKKSPI